VRSIYSRGMLAYYDGTGDRRILDFLANACVVLTHPLCFFCFCFFVFLCVWFPHSFSPSLPVPPLYCVHLCEPTVCQSSSYTPVTQPHVLLVHTCDVT
jgi:hypothetical protein